MFRCPYVALAHHANAGLREIADQFQVWLSSALTVARVTRERGGDEVGARLPGPHPLIEEGDIGHDGDAELGMDVSQQVAELAIVGTILERRLQGDGVGVIKKRSSVNACL
jgi:hypothetical protein